MSGISLQEAIGLYLDALQDHEGTRAQYGSVLNRLGRCFPRSKRFAGVTTQELSAAMFGRGGISTGRARATVNLHRSAIRGLFRYGHAVGWRKDLIVPPPPLIAPRERRYGPPTRLTVDELLLLLERAQLPMLRGMLAVAMNTALRISDVRKIQMRDLRPTGLAVVMQKTGLPDVMPITLDLADELRTYLQWLTATVGTTMRDEMLYLFPGFKLTHVNRLEHVPDPTKAVSYDWAHTRLRELLGECGIEVERREAWHMIRRSVARIYFDSLGASDHALRQTAALLGHKYTITTEQYLGIDAEVTARDESLRGKHLLIPGRNVTALRRGA